MSFFDSIKSTKPSSVATRVELGKHGEELAAAFLQQEGYQIVAANFVIPVGRNRTGSVISVELDLVAYDGPTLCFVEVKSRRSDWFAPPQANVDRRKQRQISRAARAYLRIFDLQEDPYRFDVVTVVMNDEDDRAPDIRLLSNHWTAENIRKRSWSDRYYH